MDAYYYYDPDSLCEACGEEMAVCECDGDEERAEDEYGTLLAPCIYPAECMMSGAHLQSECHRSQIED